MYPSLNDQHLSRLNKINEVRDYFIAEIRKRELMSKRLSNYIASFDYCFIVLSATRNGISVASFATVIGAPIRIASASFGFVFLLTTEIVKKLKTTQNKKA